MNTSRHRVPWLSAGLVAALMAVLPAQTPGTPSARIHSASKLVIPGHVDSNNPLVWNQNGSDHILTAITSWGGVPELARGTALDALRPDGGTTFVTHPGHGVWMEAVVPDDQGTWYAFYHHERPADECGRPDRQLPRIGAARSADQGRTWDDLGIVLDAPPDSAACSSANRFVLGGVGDVTAALDREGQFLYLYFSQYSRNPTVQGVAVARMPWADRDSPVGALAIWNDDAWLPLERAPGPDDETPGPWRFPAGTPLVPAAKPFHDGQGAADVFWGPAIHWNTYLEQYVMLLNRAKDDQFGQEGIYVSFAPSLDAPRAWSAPKKILNGGGWYPQVAGLEAGSGTDRLAGQRARLFLTGSSSNMIEFER